MKTFLSSILAALIALTSLQGHADSEANAKIERPTQVPDRNFQISLGIAALSAVSVLSWQSPRILGLMRRSPRPLLVLGALVVVYESLAPKEYGVGALVDLTNKSVVHPVFYYFGKGLGYAGSVPNL